jgi:hypothetical protein
VYYQDYEDRRRVPSVEFEWHMWAPAPGSPKELVSALRCCTTLKKSLLCMQTAAASFCCGYYVWAPAPGSPKELVSALLCCVLQSFSSRF